MTLISKQPKPLRVLIIEDDRTTSREIASLIEAEPALSLIGRASGLKAARKMISTEQPDIILYDLVLQGVERSREIADVKALAPQATVLVLTAYEETDRILRALCFGADGYLLKSDRSCALTDAILKAEEFGSKFSPAIAFAICRHFQAIGSEIRGSSLDHLSDRELEVLNWLTQGLTNKEVAKKLGVTVSAIKKHLESICKKLRVKNRTQAAVRFRLWPSWLRACQGL
ncbi:MAG TPA: response regulator transcription factor [Verrucomicrobiota bacterium]|nr:hypothetical protein [Verrucomicrobiales bacterium]HRI14577.1 response regulator transcription factor [Verrucomicrobiota bacterium]